MRVSVQVCIKGAECEVMGAVVKQRNLAAVRKHCSPKNYQSLFAIRCSLPFGLGRSLALPIFPVPRPTPLVPLKPVAWTILNCVT